MAEKGNQPETVAVRSNRVVYFNNGLRFIQTHLKKCTIFKM